MILDTNAVSAWAEGRRRASRILRSAEKLIVPTIVMGEYLYGLRQSRYRGELERWLGQRLRLVEIAHVSGETATHYADIRLELKRAGNPIPVNDVWIAAVTRQIGLPLLSNDRQFDSVSGLRRIEF